MHVLIIPSQEFCPPEDQLAGIFQLHQAQALAMHGVQIGVISIRLRLSVLMIFRAALYAMAGKVPGNALDGLSVGQLARVLFAKLTKPESYVSHDTAHGFSVVRSEGFYMFPPSPRTDHLGWIRAGLAAYDEYVARYGKPDIVHAHNLNPAGLLAEAILERHGVPFVLTEHSSFFARGLVPSGLVPLLRRAGNRAAALLPVSAALASVLSSVVGVDRAQIRVVPNVIDPEVLAAEPAVRPGADTRFVFLCIGRLVSVKNHALLLAAFHREFAGSMSTVLRIGGDGPLDSELKRSAEGLGIAGQVEFCGHLSRDEVTAEIDRCDAFVLSSSYETFGVVLIEALARGRPVIATRCGGPESFIDESDGILVEADNVEALSAALRSMRHRAHDYDPRVLRDSAIERFGPDRLSEVLRGIYAEALA